MVIYCKELAGNQGNNEPGDPMIETLVMPLPSDLTQAIIDIAVVVGELFLLMIITRYPSLHRWIIVSICFLLNHPCECVLLLCCYYVVPVTVYSVVSSLPCYCVLCCVIITLLLCTLLCHHYSVTVYSVVSSLPCYCVLCCVIITLLLCTLLCHHYSVTVYSVVSSLPCYCVLCCVIITLLLCTL